MSRGIKLPKHVRVGRQFRASVAVAWQLDEVRHRQSLVARACTRAVGVEPRLLFDVQLLPNIGGFWVLAGYEHCLGGSMEMPMIVGQCWFLTPAPDHDLERALGHIQHLAHQVDALRSATPMEGPPAGGCKP